jgi:predicted metal-dependent phosphoesterase TrpH
LKQTFRADLHCHTYCSDGSDSPLEVLHKAKAAGLQGLSITDHDSIEAYTPELFAAAEALGLRLLPGVELSSEWEGCSVHILGYGFDLHAAALRSFLEGMQIRRRERNCAILNNLRKVNCPIEEEELITHVKKRYGNRTIGRPHIAELMVEKGYVTTIREAFQKYLHDHASCYASGIKYTPREVIDVIHEAHGKAVLAHPHFLPKGRVTQQLLSLPFDGLEARYGLLHKEQEAPWVKLAEKRGWIVTGGSDYHGALKPSIGLGCSWVELEVFGRLLKN